MLKRKDIFKYNQRIIKETLSHLQDFSCPALDDFVQLFYAHVSIEDLKERSKAELAAIVLSQWKMLNQPRLKKPQILIFNPEMESHGWSSTHTVVQILSDDMPFLIDSIRMELNRLGLTIHFMNYLGGVAIKRHASGQVESIRAHVEDTITAEETTEAPVYIEIDRQTGKKIHEIISDNLYRVLDDVSHVVQDWRPMQTQMQEVIDEYGAASPALDSAMIQESRDFLQWILNNHFTFLGMRDYTLKNTEQGPAFHLVSGSGLGVLRDETHSKVVRKFSELPELAKQDLESKNQALILSKTNTRSTIHRACYTDYIGVLRYNEQGHLIGERRIIGLYTSSVYNSLLREVPLLRQKVAAIMTQSGLPRLSHDGKDLIHILNSIPKDDIIQGSVEQLYPIVMGILKLQERRRIRLFLREDMYGRFVSCLVYMPRDNFSSDLLTRMQTILLSVFNGLEAEFSIHFTDSILAQIHYMIRVDRSVPLNYDKDHTEQLLIKTAKSWRDCLREAILARYGEEQGNFLVGKYKNAFSGVYRETFPATTALNDIQYTEQLSVTNPLALAIYKPATEDENSICLKVFCLNKVVALSDALPILENMGLRVIDERAYSIEFLSGDKVYLSDITMEYTFPPQHDLTQDSHLFQQTFIAVWNNQAENDRLNQLVLSAGISWHDIVLLRSYSKYLRQIGVTYSQDYIAETLTTYPQICQLLVELFYHYFDPDPDVSLESESTRYIEEQLQQTLASIPVLDQDRIVRRFINLVNSTLRTNFFQTEADGTQKPYLSLKLDSKRIDDMPLPVPTIEIFVNSPRVEGVHLRAKKVARGGLRWSDRKEDYRTEVLGLMKAQQVKNAIIVPAGAKGGFILKQLSLNATRDQALTEGKACYQLFVSGLLDLVDNYENGEIVTPPQTRRRDDYDTYLVVAADKGTSTFSDIANSIALQRKFWLGDAFASGGSTGYDHKGIGITAKGAWVAAQRHFQDLSINLDQAKIRVVGIGDMSGDVFGNGLLLSEHIQLVAAFNHQHIFIDPNPYIADSFVERKRLFSLPRSTWMDYNSKLISSGGGVFCRSAKAIKLTQQIKGLLNLEQDMIEPDSLIKAILKAPVDLLWNGGIGTYVKASTETHAEVGDKMNDATRINASELRCQVVSEGGNLGFTQKARIEYALQGGKINTDFIDNSAGVDCSDHEVLIKIFLNGIVHAGDLTEKQRNQILRKMTSDVSELVLRDNYLQNQVISLDETQSIKDMPIYRRLINDYVQNHGLNRDLEFLPSDAVLASRQSKGLGMTRPALSVLIAYSKIILSDELLHSSFVDDPYAEKFIPRMFPSLLHKRYGDLMSSHQLHREITATVISNLVVSEMGITFLFRMQEETGFNFNEIVHAYLAIREIFNVAELRQRIDHYNHKIDIAIQDEMHLLLQRVMRRTTRWLLRQRHGMSDIEAMIERYCEPVHELMMKLSRYLLGAEKQRVDTQMQHLIDAGVEQDLALPIAILPRAYHLLNIVSAAETCSLDLYQTAKLYFLLADQLSLTQFRDAINQYPVDSRWNVLAKASAKGDLDRLQRLLTIGVAQLPVQSKHVNGRIKAWFSLFSSEVSRWNDIAQLLRETSTKDFAILLVAVKELGDLISATTQSINLKGESNGGSDAVEG